MNHILVVDDVGYTRALFQRALANEGYEVVCAENGLEALSQINNDPPNLIILDINLPDISGIEVLKELRDKKRKTPVIMITASDNPKYYQETKNLGVHAFLTKPVDLNEFLALVEKIFDPASHILVVDDEEATVELYTRFLKGEGYRVSNCDNGQTAKILLRYQLFDAVILDLNLPGIDGVELLRALRNQGDDLPVIVSTAYASVSTEEQLREFKISSFLEKPVDLFLLMEIIKGLLGTIKSKPDNDFLVIELAGNARNLNLFKSLVFNGLKNHFGRFIFDLTPVSFLNGNIEEALLAVLGKDKLLCRIVVEEKQQSNYNNRFAPFFCPTVAAAKESIQAAAEAAKQAAAAAAAAVEKPPKEEKVEIVASQKEVKGRSYVITNVPIENVAEGMILAQPIFNETGKITLVGEGTKLNKEAVDKIKTLTHITTVVIKQAAKDTSRTTAGD